MTDQHIVGACGFAIDHECRVWSIAKPDGCQFDRLRLQNGIQRNSTRGPCDRNWPGCRAGFESQAGAEWLFEILGERDAAVRSQKHLNWVDYSMFWLQYAGVFQVPKGIVVNDRIKSWAGYQQHYRNVSGNPEFIVLN